MSSSGDSRSSSSWSPASSVELPAAFSLEIRHRPSRCHHFSLGEPGVGHMVKNTGMTKPVNDTAAPADEGSRWKVFKMEK